MKQNLLLPHSVKKIAGISCIAGILSWIVTQKHWWPGNESLSTSLFTLICSLSAASFLLGLFAFIFSREKIEDELIAQLRLYSFQFAGLFQLAFIIIALLFGLITNHFPQGDKGLEIFLIISLFVFWVAYLSKFYYHLHIQNKEFHLHHDQ